MLSHVLRPMITQFRGDMSCDEAVDTFVVTLAKYAISLDNRQGRRPVLPMPLLKVAATIKVTLGGRVCISEEPNNCQGELVSKIKVVTGVKKQRNWSINLENKNFVPGKARTCDLTSRASNNYLWDQHIAASQKLIIIISYHMHYKLEILYMGLSNNVRCITQKHRCSQQGILPG
jgi:hypothetical protein